MLGKPSPAYFEAALAALDAEPELTWMVGDDLDADIAGAQRYGLKTVLVRTGQVPAGAARALDRRPRCGRLARSPSCPEWLESSDVTVGVDLIEIERIRRALDRHPSFRERCFTEEERRYCDSRPNPAQHYAARFAGKEAVGKAIGFGVARAFAWRDVEIAGRPKPVGAAVRADGGLGRAGSAPGSSTSR